MHPHWIEVEIPRPALYWVADCKSKQVDLAPRRSPRRSFLAYSRMEHAATYQAIHKKMMDILSSLEFDLEHLSDKSRELIEKWKKANEE